MQILTAKYVATHEEAETAISKYSDMADMVTGFITHDVDVININNELAENFDAYYVAIDANGVYYALYGVENMFSIYERVIKFVIEELV